jgi:Ca-activated chloride channel family protein
MTLALLLALDLAGTLSGLWHRATRATSSASATAQGVKAYDAKHYPAAESAFRQAYELAPSPRTAYNLGTAQVAAGRYTEGSEMLGKAMAAQALRADALYNRGNSALQAHAYDYAIRDYSEALRLRPAHLPTKRNLEIAQARKMEQEQSDRNQKKGSQSPSPQKPQPQPSPGKQQEQKKGESDTESLLRSVQQQEQEELSRMKRARVDRTRVGW